MSPQTSAHHSHGRKGAYDAGRSPSTLIYARGRGAPPMLSTGPPPGNFAPPMGQFLNKAMPGHLELPAPPALPPWLYPEISAERLRGLPEENGSMHYPPPMYTPRVSGLESHANDVKTFDQVEVLLKELTQPAAGGRGHPGRHGSPAPTERRGCLIEDDQMPMDARGSLASNDTGGSTVIGGLDSIGLDSSGIMDMLKIKNTFIDAIGDESDLKREIKEKRRVRSCPGSRLASPRGGRCEFGHPTGSSQASTADTAEVDRLQLEPPAPSSPYEDVASVTTSVTNIGDMLREAAIVNLGELKSPAQTYLHADFTSAPIMNLGEFESPALTYLHADVTSAPMMNLGEFELPAPTCLHADVTSAKTSGADIGAELAAALAGAPWRAAARCGNLRELESSAPTDLHGDVTSVTASVTNTGTTLCENPSAGNLSKKSADHYGDARRAAQVERSTQRSVQVQQSLQRSAQAEQAEHEHFQLRHIAQPCSTRPAPLYFYHGQCAEAPRAYDRRAEASRAAAAQQAQAIKEAKQLIYDHRAEASRVAAAQQSQALSLSHVLALDAAAKEAAAAAAAYSRSTCQPPAYSYEPPAFSAQPEEAAAAYSQPPADAPVVTGQDRGNQEHPGPWRPILGTPELPSIGSLGHASGRCKPCAFFAQSTCGSGVKCVFCHLCDAGEKKRRRKDRRLHIATKRMVSQMQSEELISQRSAHAYERRTEGKRTREQRRNTHSQL